MKLTFIASLLGLTFSAGAAHAVVATPVCAVPNGQSVVTIGHIATTTPNLDADGTGTSKCTINDLIKEEGSYSNQAAWLSHVNDVLSNQVSAGLLNSAQVAEIQAAAAAYDIKRYARVKIIGFNDFHGTLRSPGNLTFSGVATPVGGIDYFAGYVDAMRAKNPANTVILSAGDLIGASPLVSALFHDEGTVEAMNRLGLQGDGSVAYRLDYDAVGNHEFDEGKDELKRMQNGGCHPTDALHTCQGTWSARQILSKEPSSSSCPPTSSKLLPAKRCSRLSRSRSERYSHGLYRPRSGRHAERGHPDRGCRPGIQG